MKKKEMARTGFVVLGLGFLIACVTPAQPTTALPTATRLAWTSTPTATRMPTTAPTVTTTPTSVAVPTFTLTPTPLARFKILSYNILYGAGVERQYDAGVLPHLVGKNRLPDLVSFVRTINPDVWSIQEANGWERGTPPVIQQVAQELGMNYHLAQTPGGFHLGLITKFEIVETENLSAEVGR
ncbi:MAG: hypothetical protein L0Y55_17670, partial [Anaerolineales bacterium]|nr:hypothetical protein [Anaerolineales bacterium]